MALQSHIMDIEENVKPKKKKTINSLPIAIFNRLHFIVEFEEDLMQFSMESLLESYAPRVLSSCGTSSRSPKNPLDVAAFQRITNLPGRAPRLQLPQLPQSIPAVSEKRKFVVRPKYPSLIPLLMTAKFSGTDTRHYHVVAQRNSLRRIAANDEDFVINVVQFGTTLYLRCFPRHRVTNKNDVGFRFEEMCTVNGVSNVDFNQLIDGQIGKYKILMMCETDAINRPNGESIELKCKKDKVSKYHEHNWWLQAFLCKYNSR